MGLSCLCLFIFCFFIFPQDAYKAIMPETPHCTNDSHIVKACFNTYMERDMEEIRGIIYPHGKASICASDGSLRHQANSHLDGMIFAKDVPGLVEQCDKIRNVYNCLERDLFPCDVAYPFFSLRHVLYSMDKSITWMCGPKRDLGSGSHQVNMHSEVEQRFSVLLQTVHCMECLRVSDTSTSLCYDGDTEAGDSYIWLKILRLQRNPDICSKLQRELECFWTHISSSSECELAHEKEKDVYKRVVSIFVDSWCNEHPFRSSFSHEPRAVQGAQTALIIIITALTLLGIIVLD